MADEDITVRILTLRISTDLYHRLVGEMAKESIRRGVPLEQMRFDEFVLFLLEQGRIS